MSLKTINITNWLIFVIIYIIGLQIGDYVASMFSIAGYFATAVSLSLVFVLAAWLLKFRMTGMGWIMFILFGFIAALLGQWAGSMFALSGILLSFVTGTILYIMLRQFTRTVK
jgi:uncharacterized membrane protein YeaQ/YmgE (transglycosylase-associated protein family)